MTPEISTNYLSNLTNLNLPKPINTEQHPPPDLENYYFSSTKASDRYLSYALKAKILNQNGTLSEEFQNKPVLNLQKPQQDLICQTIKKTILISKPTNDKATHLDLCFSMTIESFLKDVKVALLNNPNGVKKSKSFSDLIDIQFIGGIVPHCLRKEFLQQWVQGFIGDDHDFIHELIGQQIEEFPSDIDTRIVLDKSFSSSLYYLRDEIFRVISTKIASVPDYKKCIEFLRAFDKKKYAPLNPQSVISELILKEIVNSSYLLKSFIKSDAKNEFAIVSIGDREKLIFELILQITLERPCLFRRDSLRISLKNFLDSGDVSAFSLESDFSINQVFSDWIGQIIHVPDFLKADVDDWFALMSRMTIKGERSLIHNTEKRLYEVVVTKSIESKISPREFIVDRLKKRFLNHHCNDPTTSLATVYRACTSMLYAEAPLSDIALIWKELCSIFPDKQTVLLDQISLALKNEKISFSDVLSCIEIGSFIHINTTPESNENPIILTYHEGSSVQINIGTKDKPIYLWHRFNPEKALDQLLNFETLPSELHTILSTFIKGTEKNRVFISPLKKALPNLPINIFTFNEKIDLLLNHKDSSIGHIGAYLHLACQALKPSPNFPFIKKLFILLPTFPISERKTFLNYAKTHYPSFETFFNFILNHYEDKKNILTFHESWILAMAQTTEKSAWLHACDVACQIKTDKILPLFKLLLPNQASFAIELLNQLCKKSKLLLPIQLKALGGLCSQYPKCKLPINRDEDIFILQDIAIRILTNSKLKIPTEHHILTPLKNSLRWLLEMTSDLLTASASHDLMHTLNNSQLLPTYDNLSYTIISKKLKELLKSKNNKEIFSVFQQAKKARIHWIPNAKDLTDKDWLNIALLLETCNDEEALYFADLCSEHFTNSTDPQASDFLVKMIERRIKKMAFSISYLQSLNLPPTKFLDFCFQLIDSDLKMLKFAQASENLIFLMDNYTEFKIETKIRDFLSLFLVKNKIVDVDQLIPAYKIINHNKFIFHFFNQPNEKIEIYLKFLNLYERLGFKKHAKQAINQCGKIFLILNSPNDFSSHTLQSLCCILNTIQPLLELSEEKSTSVLISSKLPLIFSAIHLHNLPKIGTELFNNYVDIIKYNNLLLHDLLWSISETIRISPEKSKETNTAINNLITLFPLLLTTTLWTSQAQDWSSKLLEIGIILLNKHLLHNTPFVPLYLLSSLESSPDNIMFLNKYFLQLISQKHYIKAAEYLFELLNKPSHFQISPLPLINELLTIPLNNEISTILAYLIDSYGVTDQGLIHKVKTKLIQYNHKQSLEIFWSMIIKELETKSIYGNDNEARVKIWADILQSLSSHQSNAALDLINDDAMLVLATTSIPEVELVYYSYIITLVQHIHITPPDKSEELFNILLTIHLQYMTGNITNPQYFLSAGIQVANVLILSKKPQMVDMGIEKLISILSHFKVLKDPHYNTLLASYPLLISQIYNNIFHYLEGELDASEKQLQSIQKSLLILTKNILDLSLIEPNYPLVINALISFKNPIAYKYAYQWVISAIQEGSFKKLSGKEKSKLSVQTIHLLKLMLDKNSNFTEKQRASLYDPFPIDFISALNSQLLISTTANVDLWEDLIINSLNKIKNEVNIGKKLYFLGLIPLGEISHTTDAFHACIILYMEILCDSIGMLDQLNQPGIKLPFQLDNVTTGFITIFEKSIVKNPHLKNLIANLHTEIFDIFWDKILNKFSETSQSLLVKSAINWMKYGIAKKRLSNETAIQLIDLSFKHVFTLGNEKNLDLMKNFIDEIDKYNIFASNQEKLFEFIIYCDSSNCFLALISPMNIGSYSRNALNKLIKINSTLSLKTVINFLLKSNISLSAEFIYPLLLDMLEKIPTLKFEKNDDLIQMEKLKDFLIPQNFDEELKGILILKQTNSDSLIPSLLFAYIRSCYKIYSSPENYLLLIQDPQRMKLLSFAFTAMQEIVKDQMFINRMPGYIELLLNTIDHTIDRFATNSTNVHYCISCYDLLQLIPSLTDIEKENYPYIHLCIQFLTKQIKLSNFCADIDSNIALPFIMNSTKKIFLHNLPEFPLNQTSLLRNVLSSYMISNLLENMHDGFQLNIYNSYEDYIFDVIEFSSIIINLQKQGLDCTPIMTIIFELFLNEKSLMLPTSLRIEGLRHFLNYLHKLKHSGLFEEFLIEMSQDEKFFEPYFKDIPQINEDLTQMLKNLSEKK